MYSWRISKYNPQYRSNKGFYQKEEWTAFSDIGKYVGDSRLTLQTYIKMENSYIRAIALFMRFLELNSLQILELEKYDEVLNNQGLDNQFLSKICEGNIIEGPQLDQVCRLALRELLWCKLEKDKFFIHFGYDYYMYIGSSYDCSGIMEEVVKNGLFIESAQSPYKNQ